jgi:hypothetical protein
MLDHRILSCRAMRAKRWPAIRIASVGQEQRTQNQLDHAGLEPAFVTFFPKK